MHKLNQLVVQQSNTLILIIGIIAGGGLWWILRRKPYLIPIVAYTGLVIWLLSLLAAFIWRS